MITENTISLNEALNNWLKAVQTEIIEPQLNKISPNLPPYVLTIEHGTKFIKVISNSSAWAFVAKSDGQTKGLGTYKQGDIFKPASWKTPAKHPRGNVFNITNGNTCGITQWTGPNYL